MLIGELLKKIRTEKNLTQKEMCQDIITTSFYSKVENGDHRISAEDLFLILTQQQIPIEEFTKELNILSNADKQYQVILTTMYEAFYKGDLDTIEQLYQNTQNLTIEKKEILLLQLKLIIAILKNELSTINDLDKTKLKETIFTSDEWNDYSLSLFANSMFLYDVSDIFLFIKSIFNTSNENDNNDEFRIRVKMTIYLNFISMCVEENEMNMANFLVTKLEEFPIIPENTFYKILTFYYKNFLNYQQNPLPEYKNEIMTVTQLFENIGMKSLSTELLRFLEENTEGSEKC